MLVGYSAYSFAQPNEISYQIDATLDTTTKTIYGTETISFTNGTGQTLDELFIYLYPNRFKEKSVAAHWEDFEDFDGFFPNGPDWGYLEVNAFSINGSEAAYTIEDILMHVELSEPLAHGAQLSIDILFSLKLPNSTRRLGYNGTNYSVSWWYPQLAVHDGEMWHTELMVGVSSAEPFQDFATYDVSLNVSSDVVVGATGDLQSEQPNSDGTKTLRYTATNVHDFAWVADSNYVKENFDCDGIEIISLYWSQHTENAQSMAETACDAMRYFGERFGKYPYSQFTISATHMAFGAMEFPQMIMNGQLFYRMPRFFTLPDMVTAHEVAHQWFYGFMANNQIAETWLDEGFAEFSAHSYIEHRYGTDTNFFDIERLKEKGGDIFKSIFVEVFGSVFNAKDMKDMRLNPLVTLGQERREAAVLTHRAEVPLGTQIRPYEKGASLLYALEDYLGVELMDRIMQTYVSTYMYTHVTTQNFIDVAEEISGENLDWLFDNWLRTTDTIDYAINGMNKEEVDGEYIHRIKVSNNGTLRMPVDVELRFKGEEVEPLRQRWENDQNEGELTFTADQPASKVVIDPDRIYPDLNRTNNTNRFPVSFQPYIQHGILLGWPEDSFYLGGGLSLTDIDLVAQLFYVLNREKIGFDVEFNTPFEFQDRRTSDLNAHARDDSHVISGDLTASLRWFTPFSFLWRANQTLRLGPFYRDRHDVEEDPGKSIGLFANYRMDLRNQRARFITLILDHKRSLDQSDFSFEISSAEVQIKQRVFWQTYLSGRVFYGLKSGSEPIDSNFNLIDHGLLRTFERQSDELIAGNLNFEFPLPGLNSIDIGILPIPASVGGFIFADAAIFPNDNNAMRADVGIGLMLGPLGQRDLLRFEYPLWLNTEEDGGVKEFRFQMNARF
jgi:hypothetical protein